MERNMFRNQFRGIKGTEKSGRITRKSWWKGEQKRKFGGPAAARDTRAAATRKNNRDCRVIIFVNGLSSSEMTQ
jgi:hypothetical protein